MVSVCLATYNGEKYIIDQLNSIRNQLSEMDEIIVSDDKSSDSTLEVIRELNDSRIKIYINEGESGYTRNFENALNKASGDYIFLSDQDDIWQDGKVTKTLEELQSSDLVICDAKIVDDNLKVLNDSNFSFRNTKTGFINTFIKIRYLGCCMAFKKNLLKAALPFPKYQKLLPHDSWISIIGEGLFNVSLLKDPLVLYRRHSFNASTGGEKTTNSIFKIIQIRLYVAICFIKRFLIVKRGK